MNISLNNQRGGGNLAAGNKGKVYKKNNATRLAKIIIETLDDAKAENIVKIDIRGKSSLTDFMIVASGRSHRHVGAIADRLSQALKDNNFGKARIEGLPHCDWVLIDGGDIIVHIFRPEVREFYNLEKMWSEDFEGDKNK